MLLERSLARVSTDRSSKSCALWPRERWDCSRAVLIWWRQQVQARWQRRGLEALGEALDEESDVGEEKSDTLTPLPDPGASQCAPRSGVTALRTHRL